MTTPPAGRFGGVVCAATLAVTTLGACTGGDGSDGSAARLPGQNGNRVAAHDIIATRWWSTPDTTKGSTIDYAAPTAAARRLHASRPAYCTVLTQTVRAGRSVLAGATADDPAVLVATQAFVAETAALAPAALAPSWKVLGSTLVKVAASGGDLGKVTGVDPRATARAASVIAHDAQAHCHVSLTTRVRGGK